MRAFPRAIRFASILGIPLLGGSCGDATGPSVLWGASVLVAVDGLGPLPQTLDDHTFSTGQRVVRRVLGDTVRMVSDSVLLRSEHYDGTYYEADGSTLGPTFRSASYTGRFTQRGDTIFVGWSKVAGLIVNDTLVLEGRTFTRWERSGDICFTVCPSPSRRVFTYRGL